MGHSRQIREKSSRKLNSIQQIKLGTSRSQCQPSGDGSKLINFACSPIKIINPFFLSRKHAENGVCSSLDCRERNYGPYLVISARNNTSKWFFCVQIWLVSEECLVVKPAEVYCLVSYYNTVVVHWIFNTRPNGLKSRLHSPGSDKMTTLSVHESFFGKLPIHWTNLIKLISTDSLYFSHGPPLLILRLANLWWQTLKSWNSSTAK